MNITLAAPVLACRLPSGYATERDPEVLQGYAGEALSVANRGSIRISGGRELAMVVLCAGVVVAGLWTEEAAQTFGFDIAVDAKHRRLGIGLCLAKIGRNLASEAAGAGFELELVAVSAGGEALARKIGLSEIERSEIGYTVWRLKNDSGDAPIS